MRVSAPILPLLALALPLSADAAKVTVPALLTRAQYVALGYDLGDGFVTAEDIAGVAGSTLTDERRVLDAIRKDLDKWGRYVVVPRAADAEILMVIRIGRRAGLEIGSTGADGRARSRGETGGGPRPTTYGAQLSSNEDRLAVYEAAHGRPGMELWSAASASGLAGSPPSLYKSFREDVERATRKP